MHELGLDLCKYYASSYHFLQFWRSSKEYKATVHCFKCSNVPFLHHTPSLRYSASKIYTPTPFNTIKTNLLINTLMCEF
jgi:hypothetical protein